MRETLLINLFFISFQIFIANGAFPDTLLVPVNSEVKAKCSCGKINDLESAKKGRFPWIASLVSKNGIENEPLCWGSLVNDRYVLSAASCTSGYSSVEVEILLSASVAQQNPRREVASIKNHPGFTIGNFTYDNDISLIKLREPVDLEVEDMRTICIPPEPPKFFENDEVKQNFSARSKDCDFTENAEDRVATMSKFKGFEIEDNKRVHKFDKINLHTLKNQSCSTMYPKRISAQLLCAEVTGDYSTSLKSDTEHGVGCRGNPGGPLIYLRKMKSNCDADFSTNSSDTMKVRFLQIGIASAQPELECRPNSRHPVLLFTRISRYISWIMDNTQDGTYCINKPN